MTLLRWLTFILGSLTVTLTVLLFWIYLSSDPRICSIMTFSPLGILMWLSQFPMTFHQTQYIMIHFITKFMTILELIGMVVIIWEMLCWRISLNSMLVLLLVNFVSGFRLELMYPWFSAACSAAINHRNHFLFKY